MPGSSKNNKRPEQSSQLTETHTALKLDLVSETGEKILEIIEASYQISVKGIDSSSIRVRNLSNRNITALGIIWTVKFTDAGQCLLKQIADYRLHKDMVKAKGIRPFAPYEEKFIPRLTNESLDEEQVIKSVGVEISFVEFEDSSGIGIEKSEMYEQLLSKRKGAEIYKQWIESDYRDNAQNVARVKEKLISDGLPRDKELENSWVEQGALIYRQWMRDILNNKGEHALQEQIHQQFKRQK
ncbi:MAG TPA: hypothetical protein VGB76_04645 [Pyrinomonadaceae bacterium]|jgi:hypothetical protein